MNQKALEQALDNSQFVSSPEALGALLADSNNALKAAFPKQMVGPAQVLSMAKLILDMEMTLAEADEAEDEQEEHQEEHQGE